MQRLAHRDVRLLLDLVSEVYRLPGLDAYRRFVVDSLPRLIPCSVSSYNELDLQGHSARWEVEPAELPRFPDAEAIFARYMSEHPVLADFARTRQHRWRKISDFVTRRQFHRTGLYNEFYKRILTEDQIGLVFPVIDGTTVGLAFSRKERNFDERDRALLSLLQPHLIAGLVHARAFTEVRGEIDALWNGLETVKAALLIATPSGRIVRSTGPAREKLIGHFGPSRRSDRLPDVITRWLREAQSSSAGSEVPRPRVPLLHRRGSTTLQIRSFSSERNTVLLLNEFDSSWRGRSDTRARLTPRQSEILRWVAAGKTNPEIAAILGLSSRTVRHHLEHIYEKLEVPSRAAAVARFVGTTAHGDDAVSR